MKKAILIHCILSAVMIHLGDCLDYTYTTEYITSLTDLTPPPSGSNPPVRIEGLPLTMSENTLRALCVDAQTHLDLDAENAEVRKHNGQVRLRSDTLVGRTQDRNFEVLSCTTAPKVWLRHGNTRKDIKIMILYSAYVEDPGCVYEIIRISAPPVPRIHPEPKDLAFVPSDRFVYGLRGTNGDIHLCWNAKKYLRRSRLLQTVVLTNNEAKADRFEFPYANGSKNHVTIQCPSRPAMYLYIGGNQYNIKVVFEEADFPTQLT